MSNPPLPDSWRVRHPWPDEIPRLAQTYGLHGLRDETRRVWYWVIATGDLDRLTGVMELAEDSAPGAASDQPPRARLEYSFRDAWAGGEAARQLLQAALRQSAELGLKVNLSQADPESAFANLLRDAGFVAQTTQEVWVCPIEAPVAEFEADVDRMLRRFPVTAIPVQDEHAETIGRICVRLKLLAANRVVLQKPGESSTAGFDPRFSFLTGDPANPSAFVLSRVAGRRLYLEVLARNPDSPRASPAAIAALLKAIMPAARNFGLDELSCVLRPSESAAVLALLRRGGGRRVRQFALFIQSRESPSPDLPANHPE